MNDGFNVSSRYLIMWEYDQKTSVIFFIFFSFLEKLLKQALYEKLHSPLKASTKLTQMMHDFGHP